MDTLKGHFRKRGGSTRAPKNYDGLRLIAGSCRRWQTFSSLPNPGKAPLTLADVFPAPKVLEAIQVPLCLTIGLSDISQFCHRIIFNSHSDRSVFIHMGEDVCFPHLGHLQILGFAVSNGQLWMILGSATKKNPPFSLLQRITKRLASSAIAASQPTPTSAMKSSCNAASGAVRPSRSIRAFRLFPHVKLDFPLHGGKSCRRVLEKEGKFLNSNEEQFFRLNFFF